MQKKTIYVLVEPNYFTPVWHAKSISGIRDAAVKKRMNICIINSLRELTALPEPVNAIIVVCTRNDWISSTIHTLRSMHIRPVLIGAVPGMFGEDVSGIILNHKSLIENMVNYFFFCGRSHIALVGINPNASNDSLKCKTFLSASEYLKMDVLPTDVYYIDTNISEHCNRFFQNYGKYDGVICSNDYVAVGILKAAHKYGIRIPEDLYVAGIGDMLLCRCVSPTLTSAARYYYETGEQAVNIWSMIESDTNVISITSTVQCRIICRESTAYSSLPPHIQFDTPIEADISSSKNSAIDVEMQSFENCLLQCDALDLKIINGLLSGAKLEDLADMLYISQRALRYRLGKIYTSANASSRIEFEDIMRGCDLDSRTLYSLLEMQEDE